MNIKNTRMTIVIISFLLILALSFINNETAIVAISSIGAITITFITGKSYTDSKQIPKMKLLDYIFIIIICAGIIYYIFVPNIVIDERIEYLKGDTITTVINQKEIRFTRISFQSRT